MYQTQGRDWYEFENIICKSHTNTNKATLKNSQWLRGAYAPERPLAGRIVACNVTDVHVEWLHHSPFHPDSCPKEEPDHKLRPQDGGISVLNRLEVFHFDSVVKFKSQEAALSKYPSTGTNQVQLSDGTTHSNVFCPKIKSETMGYDLAYYRVINIESKVKIKWQDGTQDIRGCTEVYPFIEWQDDELQPGYIVVPCPTAASNQHYACKVGVVQSVDPLERTAKVRWSQETDFVPADYINTQRVMIGRHYFPLKSDTINNITEVPTYDLQPVETLTMNTGDWVCAKHLPKNAIINSTSTWLGVIKSVNLDGSITIDAHLPLAQEVITTPEEFDVIENSYPDSNDGMSFGNIAGDWMSYSEDSYSDATSPEPMEIWYENEEGERLSVDENGDEEVWETDSEHETMSLQDADELDNHAIFTDIPDQPNDGSNQPATEIIHNGPPQYELLDAQLPLDHRYMLESSDHTESHNPKRLKRIQKEHSVLANSLPQGIYVRSWESRLDLFRVLFVGPVGTPYELAPLLIDFWFPPQFPQKPPVASFHSWTDGQGPINPNLYENGKICLSLLNT